MCTTELYCICMYATCSLAHWLCSHVHIVHDRSWGFFFNSIIRNKRSSNRTNASSRPSDKTQEQKLMTNFVSINFGNDAKYLCPAVFLHNCRAATLGSELLDGDLPLYLPLSHTRRHKYTHTHTQCHACAGAFLLSSQ